MIEIVRAQNDIVVSSEDVLQKELGTPDSLIGLQENSRLWNKCQARVQGSKEKTMRRTVDFPMPLYTIL